MKNYAKYTLMCTLLLTSTLYGPIKQKLIEQERLKALQERQRIELARQSEEQARQLAEHASDLLGSNIFAIVKEIGILNKENETLGTIIKQLNQEKPSKNVLTYQIKKLLTSGNKRNTFYKQIIQSYENKEKNLLAKEYLIKEIKDEIKKQTQERKNILEKIQKENEERTEEIKLYPKNIDNMLTNSKMWKMKFEKQKESNEKRIFTLNASASR